jgi:ABC-type antimicrobial peptide transport system permease subunit
MHILEGRDLRESDDAAAPPVLLISESLARRHWPAGQAVGRQLVAGDGRSELARTIVGVVSDIRMEGFHGRFDPTIYLPLSQAPARSFWTLISSTRPADSLAAELGAAVREIDASVPVPRPRPLVDIMGDTVRKPRFTAIVLGVFASMALFIAVVGLYGVLAFDVAERRPELGVRLALGATPGNIRRLLILRGLRLVAVGLVLGLAGTLAIARLLSGLFVDAPSTHAANVLAFGGAIATLLIASLVATWIPARRALRTDPIEVLRRS